MREAARQTIGQQKEMASYQTVKRSQDIVTIIDQAVAANPSRFSQFALVTIEFHFTKQNNPAHVYSVTYDRGTRYLPDIINTQTRQHDLIWLKDTTYYFLLAGASPQGGDIVQHRLWKALQKSITLMQEHTTALPYATTIGYSTYPEPSTTIEQCLHNALTRREMQPQDEAIQEPSLPEDDLSILARQLGVPYLPFLPRTFSNKLKRLVKPELAQELHCFPLGFARNILTVAMSNPQDNQVLNRLQQETGMQIFPVLIDPDELQNALEHIIR